jgi:hypothetical protein
MSKSLFLLLFSAMIAQSAYPADKIRVPVQDDEPALEAKPIVSDLLSRLPATNDVFVGTLMIRKQDGTRLSRAVSHRLQLTAAGWQETWEAAPTEKYQGERLIVTHAALEPNIYRYWPNLAAHGDPAELTRELTGIPFAGSDFWLCDLGLEFLHWPKQRIINKRATTGLQRPCRVLESSTSPTSEQPYAKVLSWLDIETGALLRAEAFDSGGKRFKRFEVRALRRNGSVDLDIWNDRQNTKSSLWFGSEH